MKWLIGVALVLAAGCSSATATTVNVSDAPLVGPLTASVTAVRVTTTSSAPPVTSPLGYRVLPIAALTPGTTDARVRPDGAVTVALAFASWTEPVTYEQLVRL